MTGFSSHWLALREPADHRARHAELCSQMTAYFRASHPAVGHTLGQPLRIIDLGCGSGSNLRAVAAALPAFQHWTLVDYDPALLSAARLALIAWADEVQSGQDDSQHLVLTKAHQQIEIQFLQEDLAANIERVLSMPADLVTAAAFFDLVSPDWLGRFCQALCTPFYTVLTYDGTETWTPHHAADQAMLKAFHAHQTTDKGFGLSAGPDATDILHRALTARGFRVQQGASPWQLTARDRELMQSLASGAAGAVTETGLVAQDIVKDWLSARLNAESCNIGHWDIFAIPS